MQKVFSEHVTLLLGLDRNFKRVRGDRALVSLFHHTASSEDDSISLFYTSILIIILKGIAIHLSHFSI